MEWKLTDPKPGDMLRVKVGTIYHFGVYESDSSVIQFGLPPSARIGVSDAEVKVISTDIDTFLAGGFLEVAVPDRKERKKWHKPKDVIANAKKRIGEGGYNILYNNCEHFARECVTGERICEQAESIRSLFRSLPIVDVYTAPIPETESKEPLFPRERMIEIEGVSHPRVRLEKYYVWRLLGIALGRSLGLDIKTLNFSKQDGGKWICDKCSFSLSHTEGALAVAVSRAPVGVDIEPISKDVSHIGERFLTDEEYSAYITAEGDKNEQLLKVWTKKESLFKKSGGKALMPKTLNTLDSTKKTVTKAVTVGADTYITSVATDTPERVRFFNVATF